MKNSEQLRAIVGRFDTQGTIDSIRPLGNGLINDTFLVKTAEADAPDYVLQRINTNVFNDPNALMDNIDAVTTHIRRKLEEQGADDIDRRVLQFVKASQGGKIDAEGFRRSKTSPLLLEWPQVSGDTSTFWRLCVFIPRSVSKETVDAPNSRHAGEAFGEFQSLLADLPTPLVETIPDFHNLEFRLRQLNEVVAKDPAGRVSEDAVQRMLDDIHADAPHMTLAEQLYRDGQLPKRACHCDTKVNNILFDEQGRVLCVIDLDTVMPSFI
ncbi:MAG: aminoglycoside phosphotransferase family protein, partial [Prevotella sp.]|nr:aminoglycoside phosphotransferase family protein [Prevotella sp.]